MDRILRPNLTQVNNVALGATWSCELPIGPAYRYLDVVITMTSASGLTLALADFGDLFTININSKPYRTFLLKELNSITNLFGSNYAPIVGKSSGSNDTLLPVLSGSAIAAPGAAAQATCWARIYFEEPWRKSWAAAGSRKLFTSWPSKTKGAPSQVPQLQQIQGIIPSTTNNAGATSLSVRIYAGTDASMGPVDTNGNPITNSLKWYRYPGLSYTASGDQQLNNIVKYDKGKALAILEQMDIFSQSSGDDVGRLQVIPDQRTVYDATPGENMRELISHGFNPVYNLDEFHWVADANDNVTEGLVLSTPGGAYVNSLTATATLNAASGSCNKTLVIISQV